MVKNNSKNSDPNIGDLTFEQALNRLDDTVKVLEAGGLPLAESTRLYEEGMKLARICSEMLASAELRITRIQTAYGEQMRFLAEESVLYEEDDPC
jgi:exodeoxyribonuclease VII small subunit